VNTTTTDTDTAAWTGNEQLRELLVAVDELRPHPRNPRRGVVEDIRASLVRFGQQRPLLALPDGTIVAGHHVWRAAVAEEWSHIAVVRSDLAEREVEAYLLADNRLADLGIYDDTALASLLAEFTHDDELLGIGYTRADVDSLLAYLEPATLETAGREKVPTGLPYATGEAEVFRFILSYDQATYESMVAALDALAVKFDVDSYSAVIQQLVFGAAA